ncbi:hypothetical protein [Nostoc sp. 'Lobaria pulmonaria (5183) cyanobiont']|uniref:hypothetical protein n=1 Tax=Nostoc sp. 'Lobaria pulmonaria (5183) cyanobiont' TaxID=1618022 RepID=UPI003FA5C2CF
MHQGDAVFLLLLDASCFKSAKPPNALAPFGNSVFEFSNGDGGDTNIRNAKSLEFIQYFLGFLLNEVNADVGIKQVSHLKIFSSVKNWLNSRIHEVIRKIVWTINEGLPGVIFGNEDNGVTNFFDRNFSTSELKIFGQNDHLVSAISGEFSSVHDVVLKLASIS